MWIQAVQFPGSFIYRYIRLRCYVVALRIDPGEASPVFPGVRCAHRQQRVIVLVLDVLLKVPLAQLDQGMHQFILLQGGGEGEGERDGQGMHQFIVLQGGGRR